MWSDVRQRLHQLLDRIRRLRQLLALGIVQVDLDDLLDSLGAEANRDADEEALESELTLA